MASALKAASAKAMEETLSELARRIGVRLAGSTAERQAAEWIADRFALMQLDTRIEDFPVYERAVSAETLSLKIGGAWREYPCSLFGASPGTRGKTLEGKVEVLSVATDFQAEDLSRLKGKAVVCLGCHIESPEAYRRLMAAEPLFLLMGDVRYPGDLPLADGLFPHYVRRYGAVPTVNVAYRHLWEWVQGKATRARLKVTGGMRPARSENVIGILPGRDPAAGILYVGAHHDTQAGCPGADDNASGVAVCLELARLLAPLRLRRTIQFISFGAEEQLSVGAAAYVRRHRREIELRGKLILNFDSCGSALGWNKLLCNGGADLERCWRSFASPRGWYYRLSTDLSPYGDHFPFLAAGIPALWVARANCAAGNFVHHRMDDDLEKVSMERMAEGVQVAAEFLAAVAEQPRLPFRAKLAPESAAAAAAGWRDFFGGWRGLPAMPESLLEPVVSENC